MTHPSAPEPPLRSRLHWSLRSSACLHSPSPNTASSLRHLFSSRLRYSIAPRWLYAVHNLFGPARASSGSSGRRCKSTRRSARGSRQLPANETRASVIDYGAFDPQRQLASVFLRLPGGTCQLSQKKFRLGLFFSPTQASFENKPFVLAELCPKTAFGRFLPAFFSPRRRAGTFQRVSVARPQGRNRKIPPVQTSSLSPSPEAPPGPRQERGLDPDCGKALDIGGKQRQTGEKHHSGRAGLTSEGNNDGGGRRTNF